MIIGIDPGRSKCGLALVGLDRKLHRREVVSSEGLLPLVKLLVTQFPVALVVIGDQTTSRQWRQQLAEAFPSLRVVSVDEAHSSEQARERYWDFNPPRGLLRLLPRGLRVPPEAYDDIVAPILIERYLAGLVEPGGH